MTYRILPPDQWYKLVSIMNGRMEHLPSPDAATCAVAENEQGEVKGVLFLQLAFHCEPLILDNPHVSFLRLHETLEGALADRKGLTYYAFSDLPVVEKMAEKAGMTRMHYTAVWQKEIT